MNYDIYIAMATCQKGAEQYLTRKEIPFQHAALYEEGADRERRLYAEKLEQERRKQQEERQKKNMNRKSADAGRFRLSDTRGKQVENRVAHSAGRCR